MVGVWGIGTEPIVEFTKDGRMTTLFFSTFENQLFELEGEKIVATSFDRVVTDFVWRNGAVYVVEWQRETKLTRERK
jgi:hypothetical protein